MVKTEEENCRSGEEGGKGEGTKRRDEGTCKTKLFQILLVILVTAAMRQDRHKNNNNLFSSLTATN
ncbi:uncharacterized protein G2W53_037405 [Senna tora]|uniref:Uncharacterized protein n=1 Tax=Senna tora TaxID=362788 RepID=A0A834SZ44_9FABA|nr:uncharacterized protein G2W53_037405 [Senna tora]